MAQGWLVYTEGHLLNSQTQGWLVYAEGHLLGVRC